MALCKKFHSVSWNLIVDNVFHTLLWTRNIYCCIQNGPHLMVIINTAFILLHHINLTSISYYLAIYVLFSPLKKVDTFRRVHTMSERDYYFRHFSLSPSVRTSVCPHWKVRFLLIDFHGNWWLNIFRKSV